MQNYYKQKKYSDTEGVASVSLLKACTIPCWKCCLLKAKVSGKHAPGDQFLFEPKDTHLPSLGVRSMDSFKLVTLLEGEPVVLAFQTYQKHSIDLARGVELGVLECVDIASGPNPKAIFQSPVQRF